MIWDESTERLPDDRGLKAQEKQGDVPMNQATRPNRRSDTSHFIMARLTVHTIWALATGTVASAQTNVPPPAPAAQTQATQTNTAATSTPVVTRPRSQPVVTNAGAHASPTGLQPDQRVSDLILAHTVMKEDIANLEKLESRSWALVSAVAVGLIMVVVAGLLWPQRMISRAVARFTEQARRHEQESAKDLTKHIENARRNLTGEREALLAEFNVLTENLRNVIKSETLVLTARVLETEGKLDPALDLLSEALTKNPADTATLYKRALIYKKKGRDFASAAIKDFLIAIESPELMNDPNALYALAETQFFSGQTAAARENAEKALAKGFPNRAGALTLKADSLRREFRTHHDPRLLQDALAAFDECLSAYRWHTPAILGKAQTLAAMGSIDAAIALCEEAIKAGITDTDCMVFCASIRWQRNRAADRDDALDDLARIRKMNRRETKSYATEAEFWYDLAKSARTGSNDVAYRQNIDKRLAALRTGRDLAHPKHKGYFRNRLASTLLELGHTDEAIKEAKASVADNRAYVQNWVALAAANSVGRNWVDVVAAAEAGLEVARHPPGRIWCQLFKTVALACQGAAPDSVRQRIDDIEGQLQHAPYFVSDGWLAETIMRVVRDVGGAIPTKNAELIVGITKLLAARAELESDLET